MVVSRRYCHLYEIANYLHLCLSFFIQVTADVSELLGEDKVDAILCVAGGWAGGSAKAKS